MTAVTGVASNHDFLTDYLYEVRALLHDTQCAYYQDSDLNRWINEARRQTCCDTGCLRTLLTPTFPANVAQYNIGGLYSITADTPSGGTAPYTFVTGGGGVATASTTSVPMTVTVTTAGAYTCPPVINFDSPGVNVSATAVAELGSAAGTTQAIASESGNGQISGSTDLDDTGGQPYGSDVAWKVNATGWGEICGGNGTNPGITPSATEPAPSGHGFCADTIYTLKAGNIYSIDPASVQITLYANALDITGDVYLRFWTYDWAAQTYSDTPFMVLKRAAYTFTDGALLDAWDIVSNGSVYIASGTYIYVDCMVNATSVTNWATGASVGFGYYTGIGQYSMKFNAVYNSGGAPINSITVTSDTGAYNAASLTPTVNIIPAGVPAQLADDAGVMTIVSQGSGFCGAGGFIEDASGTRTPVSASDAGILSNRIASVDGITLIWNTQRIALRNMAFQDFSAEWRGWTQYSNYPLAYSVYGNSIYIAPEPNQAYTYELDCIMYPRDLTNYTTVGEIADANAIRCVKYWAAYLARMYSQQLQEAEAFLQLYRQALVTATNTYTTRLARPYRDNGNLDY